MSADQTATPRRRWGIILLSFLVAFVVYAFSVEKTDVDLSQVRDETRREQLVRIIRALANPDLIQYDQHEILVIADVYVPCGPTPETAGTTEPYIIVTPNCGEPGDIVTIEGFGFASQSSAGIDFIPDSEFAVTLLMARFESDVDGHFSVEAELPARTSDVAQQIQAATKTRVGTWTDRQSVWTDANDNGVEDTGIVPSTGLVSVDINLGRVQSVGAVALVDHEGELVQLLGFDNESVPRSGPGQGEIPFVIGAAPSQSFADDVTGGGSVVYISSTNYGDEATVDITAPAGTDLSEWMVITYDADELNRFDRTPIGDVFAPSPRLSENALETWDKIVETVALALLATTVGTILAIPLSFLSARNLMRDIRTPTINLSLYLLAFPAGIWAGWQASQWAKSLSEQLGSSTGVLFVVATALMAGVVYGVRWSISEEDDTASPNRLIKLIVVLASAGAALLAFYLVAELLVRGGGGLERQLPAIAFIGNFIRTLGEITEILLTVVTALIGGGVLANIAGKMGYRLRTRLGDSRIQALNIPAAAAAGAVVAAVLGAIIGWLYEIDDTSHKLWIPMGVGATIGLLAAIRSLRKDSVNVGLTVYYLARTLFNSLRSIEPLVMGIVFVVWVGFGPFAGSLALALHTTAALAKLYSEQVESIDAGPMEAIRATGATRLQTVVYGVIPQIVPPYISFTMYRWDINVRMSTIIGFVGGGGIGFLLQQNINLLNYEKAAAQMLAIAIVVASMDYVSARLRERLV